MGLKRLIVLIAILMMTILFSACSGSSNDTSLSAQGEKVFATKCQNCHPIKPGEPRVGPNLVGLGISLRDTGQDASAILEESIRGPGKTISTEYENLMPAADVLGLSDEDIEALVAYLISLD